MATLKEIQDVQYSMLKNVVGVFEKNNIEYEMAYGTFLGAIRHQGCIPWDDDVDIYVLDKQFKKNINKIKNDLDNTLFLQYLLTDLLSPWIYYKIRKNNTYMHEEALSEKYDSIHQGIWIDIFPLVHAAKNKIIINVQLKLIYICQYIKFYLADSNNCSKVLMAKTYNFLLCVLYWILDNCVIMLGNKKSGFYIVKGTQFCGKDYMDRINRTLIPKEIFDDKELYKYNDSFFYGPKDYDKYLKQFYGNNYMTPKKYGHVEDYSKVKIQI